VSVTASQGLVTHSAGVLTWNLGAISDGAGAIMTVEVATTNIGSAAYTASVSAAQTDHNPANNTANESTFFGVTDIIADIIDSPDPATAGVPMTLTVIVTNAGPDAATGTTLGFSVDGDFYVVGGVLSQGTYTLSFNGFSCTLGTILPGHAHCHGHPAGRRFIQQSPRRGLSR
jgi:subtilase family serine protease